MVRASVRERVELLGSRWMQFKHNVIPPGGTKHGRSRARRAVATLTTLRYFDIHTTTTPGRFTSNINDGE